jgi:predicted AAA+ superfamily ATPase
VIGKAAAYEYENACGLGDYSTSVSRTYQKQSLISTLRPVMIFVQVDLLCLSDKDNQREAFLNILIQLCKECNIDGVVLNGE